MQQAEFAISGIFRCGGQRWRCTDIGTRTIIAICIDRVEVQSTASEHCRTLDHAAAEAEGWFNGPPYAVAEHVFDENDIDGCSRGDDEGSDAEALP